MQTASLLLQKLLWVRYIFRKSTHPTTICFEEQEKTNDSTFPRKTAKVFSRIYVCSPSLKNNRTTSFRKHKKPVITTTTSQMKIKWSFPKKSYNLLSSIVFIIMF